MISGTRYDGKSTQVTLQRDKWLDFRIAAERRGISGRMLLEMVISDFLARERNQYQQQ